MKLDESMKKEINEEMEKIQAPSSLYQFAKNIKEESEINSSFEKTKGTKRGWKKTQFAVAVVISLGVLAGSAYLNPTMAEMVSKIPYLGQVFQRPILEAISEALEDKGYKPAGVGMGIWEGKPHFDIRLKGTEEYVNQEKDKVLSILTEVLEKRGYDNYELVVSGMKKESPELAEIVKKSAALGDKLKLDLQVAGYPITKVNANNPVIKLYIPINDKEKEVEIYKAAVELLKANGTPKQVQVIAKDVSDDELEIAWMSIMRAIEEEFYLKKDYQVAKIKYSYTPEKLSITIMTNLEIADAEAKKTISKIREDITDFLDSEEIKTKTEKQKYELNIQDKNLNNFPL